MIRIFASLAAAVVLLVGANMASATTISVFATGTMPVSSVTDGTETWEFSGTIPTSLPDFFTDPNSGTFEFDAATLANLSFTVDGTEVGFLAPTGNLDSRIAVTGGNVQFSLFLDPTDPLFEVGTLSVAFSFVFSGSGPFAGDVNDLSTIFPLSDVGVTTNLQIGGQSGFEFAGGTGSLTVAPVPVPPAGVLLGLAFPALFWIRRRVTRQV